MESKRKTKAKPKIKINKKNIEEETTEKDIIKNIEDIQNLNITEEQRISALDEYKKKRQDFIEKRKEDKKELTKIKKLADVIQTIECPDCGKSLSKGSLLRHKKLYHISDKNENHLNKLNDNIPDYAKSIKIPYLEKPEINYNQKIHLYNSWLQSN